MERKFWEFRNSADGRRGELLLYGDIASETWYGDEVTPKLFADELRALGAVDEIDVRITSGGGDVFAAHAIGNDLEQHPAQVTAYINGICASSATIIACHCDKVIAARDSTYMIHPIKVRLPGYVGVEKLHEGIAALEAMRENVVELYAKKTGRDKAEVAALMDATSWWTAAQAKEQGFVDALTDEGGGMAAENRGGMLFINSVDAHTHFSDAPEFVQNRVAAGAAGGFADTGDNEEGNEMEIKTVDDLRRAYPELANQLEQGARQTVDTADKLRAAYPELVDELTCKAAQEERARIEGIENMALPGSEDLTREAKFTKPMNAANYAMAVMQRMKEQGCDFLNALNHDAQAGGVNDVGSAPPADGGDGMAKAIAQAKQDAAQFLNGKKKNPRP